MKTEIKITSKEEFEFLLNTNGIDTSSQSPFETVCALASALYTADIDESLTMSFTNDAVELLNAHNTYYFEKKLQYCNSIDNLPYVKAKIVGKTLIIRFSASANDKIGKEFKEAILSLLSEPAPASIKFDIVSELPNSYFYRPETLLQQLRFQDPQKRLKSRHLFEDNTHKVEFYTI